MNLVVDGVTPVPRLVMVDEFWRYNGYFCELAEPLFLAPGDRVLFDGMKTILTVTRANGETFSPAVGTWGIHCGSGHPRI